MNVFDWILNAFTISQKSNGLTTSSICPCIKAQEYNVNHKCARRATAVHTEVLAIKSRPQRNPVGCFGNQRGCHLPMLLLNSWFRSKMRWRSQQWLLKYEMSFLHVLDCFVGWYTHEQSFLKWTNAIRTRYCWRLFHFPSVHKEKRGCNKNMREHKH